MLADFFERAFSRQFYVAIRLTLLLIIRVLHKFTEHIGLIFHVIFRQAQPVA